MDKTKEKNSSNRELKSSAFTTYFSDPKNAAMLYSALEGVPVAPEDIRYTTLEGVLFVTRKNDLAFTVKNRVLVISEHQATINQNMPLRGIIYYGRTMERLIDSTAIYRQKQLSIPTPEFYVFYNGTSPFPSEQILKLSDSYIEKTTSPMLELIVKVININLPIGHDILEKCRPLYEYSWFIQKIRDYQAKGFDRDTAVTLTIKACEKEGIMVDFVREHGTEAVNMLFTQFNMEDALAVRYEEGVEDGVDKGNTLKLIQQIYRKLQKDKPINIIAEELEESPDIVEKICTAIEKCGSDSDIEKIYNSFISSN